MKALGVVCPVKNGSSAAFYRDSFNKRTITLLFQ
jgi:hypothetical protein